MKSTEISHPNPKLIKTTSRSGKVGKNRENLKLLKATKDQKGIILTLEELYKLDLPPRELILAPWLPMQSISMLCGWRGVGKTWLAMSIADAVTSGKSFGPWKVPNPVPCFYLDGEMPIQEYRTRFQAIGPEADRVCQLYPYSSALANFLGDPQPNLSDPKWRIWLKNQLLELGVRLLIVDNIGSLSGGIDENSRKDWFPINIFFIDLKHSGISTLMIHHFNKEMRQRGTSAREDNIDSSLELRKKRGSKREVHFIVSFSKDRVSPEFYPDIEDREFKLIQTHGRAKWEHKLCITNLTPIIEERLSKGDRNKDIAKELGISQSRVSQVKSGMKKKGNSSTSSRNTGQKWSVSDMDNLDENDLSPEDIE